MVLICVRAFDPIQKPEAKTCLINILHDSMCENPRAGNPVPNYIPVQLQIIHFNDFIQKKNIHLHTIGSNNPGRWTPSRKYGRRRGKHFQNNV